MAKPTELPEWDINNTNSVEPDDDRKLSGWAVVNNKPEKPPFQWWNYMWNLQYKWIKWLDEAKALLNGDETQKFKVAEATEDNEAVNKAQMEANLSDTKLANDGLSIIKQNDDFIKNQCTAWVNFDGTDGSIRDSFNVSSVVRDSAGKYTINFSSDMDNANYCPIGNSSRDSLNAGGTTCVPNVRDLSYCKVNTADSGGTISEYSQVYVSIFGGKD